MPFSTIRFLSRIEKIKLYYLSICDFSRGDDFIKYNFNIPITYTQHIFTLVYEKTRLPVAVIFIFMNKKNINEFYKQTHSIEICR